MNSPIVSVVMTCYNHEKYIKYAVDSILNQTIRNIELIIVNDGSSDKTSSILQQYTDSRMTVINQENSGTSSATNTALRRCTGDYVALMSGDDISMSNRFENQINQLINNTCDIVFSLPEIIDGKSNLVSNSICPWFFDKTIDNTYQLYRDLFRLGNFLNAPSAFMSRSIVEKIGYFNMGLLQLQDFDYWIRACKQNAKVMLFNDPVIKYRFLPGENLSDSKNMNRGIIETQYLYDSFLDNISDDFFLKAFEDNLSVVPISNMEIEIEKMLLLYHHANPVVQMIGAKKIISATENDNILWKLIHERNFSFPSFFKENNQIAISDKYYSREKAYHFIRKKLSLNSNPFIVNENKKKEIIHRKIEQGNINEAISLAQRTQINISDKPIQFVAKKIFSKIISILLTVKNRIKNYLFSKKKYDYVIYGKLERVLDYCQRNNGIIFQGEPENIFLHYPELIGYEKKALFQGYAKGPIPYVGLLQDVVITSDSNIIATKDGYVLNDEMINYSGEEFGIKSPYILYRYDKEVIIGYKKHSRTKLDCAILISNGHDYNYFHWLLESLPRVIFIDDFPQFKDFPIIIPKDLHPNLVSSLERINSCNHPIVKLEAGISCMVKQLVVPSALSTVVDRYDGTVKYNDDIILSSKWIFRTSEKMKQEFNVPINPWRKLFLTRRKGIRKIDNIEELEQILIAEGFEIIDLENLSIDSQITLFSQAKCVVAPTGAAITNIMFCQPNTKVFIMMSDHELTNYYMWSQLGDIFNLDIRFIIGKRKYRIIDRYSVHDDYIIDFTNLLSILRKEKKL